MDEVARVAAWLFSRLIMGFLTFGSLQTGLHVFIKIFRKKGTWILLSHAFIIRLGL